MSCLSSVRCFSNCEASRQIAGIYEGPRFRWLIVSATCKLSVRGRPLAKRFDRGSQTKRRRSPRVASLVTANGGIARAAYTRALSAGLAVGALLKNAGPTQAQIRKPEVRIPVRSQVKFLNELAAHLNDEFLGIHLAQSIDLRELGLIYYVLASSEDLQNALMRLARYSAVHNEGVNI